MTRFINYWIPPAIEHADAETRRRAHLIVQFAVVMCCVIPVMAVIYGLHGEWHLGLLALTSLGLQPLTLIVLKHTGRLTWGAHTLCALLWATLLVLATFTGGVNAPVLSSNVVLVVLGTMLGGERVGRFWVGVVFLTLLTTMLRTKLSIGVEQVFDRDQLMEFRMAEPLATCAVLFAVCIIYERLKDRMLRQVEAARHRAEQAHRDTKLILDNTGQGFVTLNADAVVVGEMSAIVQRFLPTLRPGGDFVAVLSSVDAAIGGAFRVAWEQLLEGVLPRTLNIEQMPRHLTVGREHYSIEYRVLDSADGRVDKVVVILSDVTAQLAQERAEAEQRELLAVFHRIIVDRSGVNEFVDEGSPLVENLVHDRGDRDETMRWLHTLKGNSGLVGLTRFASLCHELEDDIEQSGERLSVERREALDRGWNEIVSRIRPFLGEDHGSIVLDRATYEHFQRRLLAGEARAALAHDVQLWSFESLELRLRRYADRAVALCSRLNKTAPEVTVDAGGVRLEPSRWGAFWAAFVHVVRNAVDHGFETPEERAAAGKPPQPTLSLKAYEQERRLVIEVVDDGRGIDWDAITARAQRLGLPHTTPDELSAALFVDGLSSRDQVTQLSGRGVGLAALRQACEGLGGAVEVHSRRGQGSQFLFSFPLHKVSAGVLRNAA